MLAAMFSGRMPTRKDMEGRYFIDRDGRLFHYVLNYIRDGSFPVALSAVDKVELEREALFYGLEGLVTYLRAELKPRAASGDVDSNAAQPEAGLSCVTFGRVLTASEAAQQVLQVCLEDWPEFPDFVQKLMDRLYMVAGMVPEAPADGSAIPAVMSSSSGIMLDESVAVSLQTDTLAVTQVELVHIDPTSKTWRWSDRKTGVNSVTRMKLLQGHLRRLGYVCRVVPLLDLKVVSGYAIQIELPMPA